MRQAGFIAAAGKYALQNNVSRLNNDRDKALQIERTLQSCDWLDHVIPVETNIVIFILKVNDCSNKKKLKDAKTIVGKEPIFRNKSIKLKNIRMIGNWNEGFIVTGSSFFDLVLNIESSK